MRKLNKVNVLKGLFVICCFVFAFSLYKVIIIQNELNNDSKQFVHLEDIYYKNESNDSKKTNEQSNLNDLKQINDDVVAWISIENTGIDYPVMLSKEDPYYYIHKDFEKNDSPSGVPFVGENCDLNSDNLLIYGHNMKNGTMFAPLVNYKDKQYWNNHKYITLDTLHGKRNYEIFAAFYSKAYSNEEENVFRYYNYTNFADESSFTDFLQQVNNVKLYETDSVISYGTPLLTLSTCEYSVEDGRFVVLAQLID